MTSERQRCVTIGLAKGTLVAAVVALAAGPAAAVCLGTLTAYKATYDGLKSCQSPVTFVG